MSWGVFLFLMGGGYAASRFLHRNGATRAATNFAKANAVPGVATHPLASRLPYLQHEHPFAPVMTREEALLTLGFEGHDKPSEAEIEKQFRQVIVHHHSDSGGSGYICQKILEARKILT